MLRVNNLIGFGAAAGASTPTLTYVTSTANTTDGTTFTFSSHSIGTAASDRLVVVAVSARDSSGSDVITGVTIDGNAATSVAASASSASPTAIFSRSVPSGTTADIVVSVGSSFAACVIHVYTITGLSSTTAVDTLTSVNGSSDPTGTIDVSADGVLIAVAQSQATTTATWTGVTEDYDAQTETRTHTAASDDGLAAETNRTVTCNFASDALNTMCVASWR
jgi:hypothetical protein